MMKKVLIQLLRILPLRNMIIFESHPDFSDNSFALYEEFLRQKVNERYKIYWMKTFRDSVVPELPENVEVFENDTRTFAEMIKRAYVLNCSKFIIDCNSFVYKRREKQVRLHLGHGMPVKIDLEYSRKFGDCDKYMVQSEFWKDIYTEQILVPEDKLSCLGYPRNDVLVNKASCKQWKKAVQDYSKIVLWMPTYRQHRRHMDKAMECIYPFGMPCIHSEEELEKFHEMLCEKNVLVLFRPHPVQELSVFERSEFSNIKIADDTYLKRYGLKLYELLGNTDGLITDYSSVYFDYLLTNKPVALTIEDKDEYFQYFTPAFPEYKEFIKGYYVEKFEDLVEFVEEMMEGEDSSKTAREKAKKMFHSDTAGKSAVNIYNMLVSEYDL